jgi:acyl-CoA synthetase (AMP-forming)/AMP-acid ligase II/thioesterase domain-containing protein/aryl carrier-like protein
MAQTATSGRSPLLVPGLIERWARSAPGETALLATDGRATSYGRLMACAQQAAESLRGAGFGPGSRLATVLPDTPDTVAPFLGALSAGVAWCPLSPALRRDEVERYVAALRADAILAPPDPGGAARQVAESRGIPFLTFEPDGQGDEPAIRPASAGVARSGEGRLPDPGDLAMVFHTSGTTSRPKLVPLTHGNVVPAILGVVEALRLTSGDRCLNVMPLSHLHGLGIGILASLAGGGRTVCAAGFDGARFFDWLREFQVTWYSAASPVHKAVLDALARDPGAARGHSLRFVRSGSSRLAPSVMEGLEKALGVPVIDSYGMSEAVAQLATNLLPPGRRKVGSVGVAAGSEIAVIDAAGTRLPTGQTGEVVIRGPSVTAGYENDDEANRGAFIDGWLRTGDRGYLDEDGFLFLRGRLKEVINCGGETVSPFEVDEVLMRHPAVKDAAAFPLPDRRLGEAVGAAAVLHGGAAATEPEIIRFASERLAHYKVPRAVFFVDALPRGATGKVRRAELSELAEEWSAAARQAAAEARGRDGSIPVFGMLRGIWADVAGREGCEPTDNFFELGGDSVSAMRLLARVEEASGTAVPAAVFYADPTLEGLARALVSSTRSGDIATLVELQPEGTLEPLHFVAAGPPWLLFDLAHSLRPDRPLCVLHPMAIAGPRWRPEIGSLAQTYLDEVRNRQAGGPYFLAGISAGGLIALEMARALLREGEQVAFVGLIDSVLERSLLNHLLGVQGVLNPAIDWFRDLAAGTPEARRGSFDRAVRATGRVLGRLTGRGAPDAGRARVRRDVAYFVRLVEAQRQACRRHIVRPFPGRIDYFWAEGTRAYTLRDPRLGWDRIAEGGLVAHRVPGDHHYALASPHVEETSRVLREAMADAAADLPRRGG